MLVIEKGWCCETGFPPAYVLKCSLATEVGRNILCRCPVARFQTAFFLIQ
ncbi:hypothetical protein NEIPOLOT_00373 [Neisseria polysaccharea ATCC 43768]|nr:hypothetical protein NEIPOLOT_00373 [Neisseria polysaccharea ATCC 43768]